MPANKPSARAMIATALLVFSAILAWRISGGVSTLLHDYDVHLRLLATVPHPAAPKVIPVPPKVAQIACHP